MPEH